MDHDLEKVLGLIKEISEKKWLLYLLQQDRYYRHFSEEQCRKIVMEAKHMGQQMAQKVINSGETPLQLAETLGIIVETVGEQDFMIPGLITMAQYHDNKIMISRKFLDSMDEYQDDLEMQLGKFSAYDILFYHELFHYFEEVEQVENASLRISVSPLPFLTKNISPDSAGEIAAFEFTRIMAGIEFYPCVLEVIALWKKDHESAMGILSKLS